MTRQKWQIVCVVWEINTQVFSPELLEDWRAAKRMSVLKNVLKGETPMSRFLKPLGYVGLSGLLLMLPAAARAVTFTFDTCGTGGGTGACSGPQTFTIGSFTITATAFGPGDPNLYAKQAGGDEIGLGLTNDSSGDHEITAGSFIQLQLSSNIVGYDPLSIVMDSSTSPDGWAIYQTNVAGALPGGSALLTGTNEEVGNSISPTDTYLDITATNGNVLLNSLAFSTERRPPPTPEPSGLALLGTSILGLAGVARRKLKI